MTKPDGYIVFDRENYKSEEEFWSDIAQSLKILTKNNQICVFKYADVGIYILEHSSDKLEFGGPTPIWMTEEEYYENQCLIDEAKK